MFDRLQMGYKVATKVTYDFGDEIHPGGGGMSTFVFLSTTMPPVTTSTFAGSTAVRKAKTHKDSDYTAMIAIIH